MITSICHFWADCVALHAFAFLAKKKCMEIFNAFSINLHRFEGKILKINMTEEPANILWSNLGTSKFELFCRQILGWFLTMLLWLGSKFDFF